MAKKKDPFAKENIDSTLDERQRQFESLTAVVSAMDGELKAKIAKKLMEGTDDATPNYNMLNRNSKAYDEAKAQAVIDIIDSHYDVKNDISPLRKALDTTKIDKTSRRLVENLYMGHKDQLKKAVGQAKFHAKMEYHQSENIDKVKNQLLEVASSDYNAFQHGENLVDHLKDKYKLDTDKVDVNMLKAAAPNVLSLALQGVLNAEKIYDLAPKYKKKKEAA
jgi:hypothetical protein